MVGPIAYIDAMSTLSALLEDNNFDNAANYLRTLHPADSAELIAELEPAVQAQLVQWLETDDLAEVMGQMYQEDMAEVAQHLDLETLADVLDEMEPDVAADLLGEMEPAEAAELLDEMDEASPVATLMKYGDETAGGIMNLPPPSLRRYMTVAEAIAFLKQHYQDAEQMFYLYVLDRNAKLIGVVNLRSLVLANSDQTIDAIMDDKVISVRIDQDQEEAANLISRYDLLALPVVDRSGKLAGIITVDDLVDVLEEEATEDIYRLAQVGEDAEVYSTIPKAVRNRLPWLIVNTGTAFLASVVYSFFTDTIDRAAFLAVLTPIVAGQGGNAGTQTMTVIVRSLALGEVQVRDTLSALWHEARVGLINGLTIGTLVGLGSWLWRGNPLLGIVIAVALMGNMIVAALAGVLIPMTLKALRIDPALASSVFVTMLTDSMGFLFFLGLATYYLKWLL